MKNNRDHHYHMNETDQHDERFFLIRKNKRIAGVTALKKTKKLLRCGKIIGIQSPNGFHLACDAFNIRTIERLRKNLYRPKKPFAVMVRNETIARKLGFFTEAELHLLHEKERPIVLVHTKGLLPDIVAPNNNHLGLFLPKSRLHEALFSDKLKALIMTSANYANEPIIIEKEKMESFIEKVGDVLLVENQPINRRRNDSVIQMTVFGKQIIRQGNKRVKLLNRSTAHDRPILALGSDLNNTITLINNNEIIQSEYIGDLSSFANQLQFEQMIDSTVKKNNVNLLKTIIVHDKHPEFYSTRYANKLSAYKKISIQHHKAHLASVIGIENKNTPVIGICFDGTGYGDDGTIWGGEIFTGTLSRGFKRYGHLRHAALIGGDAAIKMPLQTLAGFFKDNIQLGEKIGTKLQLPNRFSIGLQILKSQFPVHTTSSVGRLFDAVAALLGFHNEVSFEGEAAIWLEHKARQTINSKTYQFSWTNRTLDYMPLLKEIVKDIQNGIETPTIANGFHQTIAKSIVFIIKEIIKKKNINTVAFTGGVFQNGLLLEKLVNLLQKVDVHILIDDEIAVNDSSISFGQAVYVSQMDCVDNKERIQ